MSDQLLNELDAVYVNANRLVTGVAPEQWEQATPCSEWTTHDLVNHMVGTSIVCHASATKGAPTSDPAGAHLGDDPADAFAAQAATTLAAWQVDGATEGMVTVPAEMPAVAALAVNVLDIGVHCWDLATATGQDHGLTPAQISLIDEWNHNVVSDDVRAGGGFGIDLSANASSEPLARMLAFVGRTA